MDKELNFVRSWRTQASTLGSALDKKALTISAGLEMQLPCFVPFRRSLRYWSCYTNQVSRRCEMINMLGHHVNKFVLVSLPSIFPDIAPRACKLIAVEEGGLWLESEVLTKTIFPNAERGNTKQIFIPFAQIACLVEDAAARPVPARLDKATAGIPAHPKRNPPAAPKAKRRR